MIANSLLYPQQQVTGNVLGTGEVRSSGRDVSLTSNNGGVGIGEDQSSGRNVAFAVSDAGLGFGWEIDFWANSGAASRLRMPAILPALRSMTICRC
jgi:hypothetical protein